MPAWPGSLPQRLRQVGYRDQLGNGVLASDNDAGPPFERRRFSAVSRYVSGSVPLSQAQRDTLDAFFVTTLFNGLLAFDWVDPHNGDPASVKFRRGTPPTYENQGAKWIATLDLEVLP